MPAVIHVFFALHPRDDKRRVFGRDIVRMERTAGPAPAADGQFMQTYLSTFEYVSLS
jgi:hypothetical protein